jgi:hypothetical protein
MGLIWLLKPVLWHSSRDSSGGYDFSAMTEEQRQLISARWHNVSIRLPAMRFMIMRSMTQVVHSRLGLRPDDARILLRCHPGLRDLEHGFPVPRTLQDVWRLSAL